VTFQLAAPFTEADNELIRASWNRMGLHTLASKLRRRPESVERQAERLGLDTSIGGLRSEGATERATRQATILLARNIIEVARRRGVPLPVHKWRPGA
jgi:hypothetical protein